jgi:hypothetical protein
LPGAQYFGRWRKGDLHQHRGVPDRFDLTIAHKERSFRARMAWRSIDEAGVEFLGVNENAETVPLEWARRLRNSEVEKAALRSRVKQLSESGV